MVQDVIPYLPVCLPGNSYICPQHVPYTNELFGRFEDGVREMGKLYKIEQEHLSW